MNKSINRSINSGAPRGKLLSHFLATLEAQEKADCTSMLSSIDSCQNRVSADRIAGSGVDPSRWSIFFEVIRFQMIAGSGLLFFLNSYQICCVYVRIAPHYYDFKLTSDAKIRPFFFKIQAGKTFSYHSQPFINIACRSTRQNA